MSKLLVDEIKAAINIGYTGENKAEPIVFDYSSWVNRYGVGELTLSVKRPIDEIPYPVPLYIEGTSATWLVSNVDVSAEGTGVAELVYKVKDVIKKSAIFKIYINKSLADATGVPEHGQTWLDQMNETFLKTKEQATLSKNSADASEGYKDQSELSAQKSEEFSKLAEQSANKSGYMFFTIKDGRLIMNKTENTVDFILRDGRLILNG